LLRAIYKKQVYRTWINDPNGRKMFIEGRWHRRGGGKRKFWGGRGGDHIPETLGGTML